jgi:DNA repair exonuclease SbcCD ATPase subunit
MRRALTTASVKPKQRSPERDALAAAIERHSAAARLISAIEAAQPAAKEAVYAAQDAAEAASATIAEAQANAALHLASVALGTAGAAPLSVKDARAAAQDAQDAYDAARAARAALEEQHRAATGELQTARYQIESRIRDVIKSEANIEKLLADFVATHRELVSRRRALEWLDFRNAVPKGIAWRSEGSWPDLPGATTWKSAATALEADPDAPLPA